MSDEKTIIDNDLFRDMPNLSIPHMMPIQTDVKEWKVFYDRFKEELKKEREDTK